MAFAIKADVRTARAAAWVFVAQKTMYGGKHIARGDTIFVFASEHAGGQGLIARGVVTSAEAPKRPGSAGRIRRQTRQELFRACRRRPVASIPTRHPVYLPRWLLTATFAAIGACGASETPSSPGSCRVPTPPAPLASPEEVVPCPTAAELDGLDSEIPVSFENGTDQGDLVCRAADGSRDLTEFQKDVYQALVLMKSMTFDSPLPWTHRPLFDWFRLAVRGVRIRAGIANDFCCEPTRVINLRGVASAAATRWSYLEMLVHEARHADASFPHTCGSRDNTIDELGAFGVQHYLMVWIGSHWPAATEAERAYGLNRAAWLRVTAFCQECL